MKLLYFTTASNPETYEIIQSNSRVKASVASQVFESALLSGLSSTEDLELTLYSFPMIAAFPGSPLLAWGAKKQKTAGEFDTTWLPTINLYVLKQLSQKISARKAVRQWLKDNKSDPDKAILLYSVYEPIASYVLQYGKKYGCKVIAIVPDLPRDMYKVLSSNPIKASLQKHYMKRAVAIQGQFDGYIYLTEAMSHVVAPGKPYTVIEGIADTSSVVTPTQADKSSPRGIMYAGALSRKYGLEHLVTAFLALNIPDTELWLFGGGDYADELKESSEHHRNIRFFGRVSRREVLDWEHRATLLVNVRDPQEEFTKYSFPSKTLEYMLSGTPLLTTALPGIPKEYQSCLYTIGDNAPDTIRTKMYEILSQPTQCLIEKGNYAQHYVMMEKNEKTQADRLLNFIRKLL